MTEHTFAPIVEPLTVAFAHPTGASLHDVARDWLKHLQDVKRRTALTVYQYAAKLESLAEIVGDDMSQVTPASIETWLQRPRTGRGHGGVGANATLAKEVSIVSSLWRFAMGRGHVTHDPTAELYAPPVRNENPNPIADTAWVTQWQAPLPCEARAFVGLAYFAGLRRAELVNLAPAQIDLRGRRLVKFRRKGGGDDVLDYGELAEIVAECLPELLPDPSLLFGNISDTVTSAKGKPRVFAWSGNGRRSHVQPEGVTDPQLVYRRLRRWQVAAGLQPGAYTPHMLRHAFVTNLLRCGMPIHLVSRLANHRSIATTMRYSKLGGADVREWRRVRRLQARDYNRWEAT